MISPTLTRFGRKTRVNIILREPGPRGRLGNITWVQADRFDDVPALISQESTQEYDQGRATVVDIWWLYLRPRLRNSLNQSVLTQIDASSQVEHNDKLFEVVGTPCVVDAGGGVHHLEVGLRLVKDNADG